MKTAETVFVIPTYRLRDVTETIETYDEHFWSNGHAVKMIVLDDSSLANHEKYCSRLEHTKMTNELFRWPPRKGTISVLFEQKASGQEIGGAGSEPLPAELWGKSELHINVHAGRFHGQCRRRYASLCTRRG